MGERHGANGAVMNIVDALFQPMSKTIECLAAEIDEALDLKFARAARMIVKELDCFQQLERDLRVPDIVFAEKGEGA